MWKRKEQALAWTPDTRMAFLEAFGARTRVVVVLAGRLAAAKGWPEIGREGILLSLLGQEGGAAANALASQGFSRTEVEAALTSAVRPAPSWERTSEPPLGEGGIAALLSAGSATVRLGDASARTGHLLAGLIADPGNLIPAVVPGWVERSGRLLEETERWLAVERASADHDESLTSLKPSDSPHTVTVTASGTVELQHALHVVWPIVAEPHAARTLEDPGHRVVRVAESDGSPGTITRFTIEFEDPEGKRYTTVSDVIDRVPGRRISFRVVEQLQGWRAYMSTWELAEVEGAVRLTLTYIAEAGSFGTDYERMLERTLEQSIAQRLAAVAAALDAR